MSNNLYSKIINKAVKHCVSFSKVSEFDAQEAVQDTFLEYIESGINFEEGKAFEVSFFRRAREIAWNNKRRGTRVGSTKTEIQKVVMLSVELAAYSDNDGDEVTIGDSLMDESESPEERVMKADTLAKTLKGIPSHILNPSLLYLHGFSQNEIGKSFGVSQDTVSLRYKSFVKMVDAKRKLVSF